MTFPVRIIMGAAGMETGHGLGTDEAISEVLNVLDEFGITTIDSAILYGDSMDHLGATGAGKRFAIDSKALGGFGPGTLSNESVVHDAKECLRRTGTKKLDVFFCHAPDYTKTLDEWVPGFNEAHKQGLYTRFGLSNFKASDVEDVHAYCKKNGYVLPTVYQGNYNPVARRQETELFPTLRKLNISFHAYSPVAGGFLTKERKDILEQKGRFKSGQLYSALYTSDAYLDALDGWNALAEDAGLPRGEVAYRWAAGNSHLKAELDDALILGASSVAQLRETLGWLKKGPLPQEVARKIDLMWATLEKDAIVDNFHTFLGMKK